MDKIVILLFVIATVNALSFVAFGIIISKIEEDIKGIRGILHYRM